jgi:hypothetical protein
LTDSVRSSQCYGFDADSLEGIDVDGIEVFSLIRESDLEADDYLTKYFDTGKEITS